MNKIEERYNCLKSLHLAEIAKKNAEKCGGEKIELYLVTILMSRAKFCYRETLTGVKTVVDLFQKM